MAQPRKLADLMTADIISRLPEPPQTTGPRLSTDDSVCPICKGAGWLRIVVPVGDPNFGRPIMCECLERKIEEERYERSLRHPALEAVAGMTFENFDSRVPGVEEAFKHARQFARDPYGWLVLMGPPGTGKTHLAAAIANESRLSQPTPWFAIVPDLLDHLRATFSPSSSVAYDDLFESIRASSLLILDDLGTENATPWAEEKLYQIINYRYNYRLPTIITTNRRADRIDERIHSRMSDRSFCTVIEINAKDYRQRSAGQRKHRDSSRR